MWGRTSNIDQQMMIMQAQAQLEGSSDFTYRMMNQCFKKCIVDFTDAELKTGESNCIERCTTKYFEVHQMIGEKLQKISEEMQQQQQRK
mmetsp:Transcript_2637/g.3519  ORF Transcript_2637/g.3519 Transcript_2637/m.3519 type:complete len:89 (+) Transcript_2637:48-314(+)